METIVLGGGCFWCLDALYREVRGVLSSVTGYAGGTTNNPTYESVSNGKTGHAEVVQVTFNPGIIRLETILGVYWTMHDPTTPDRQGADVGPQYRSIVLYGGARQKRIVESIRESMQAYWEDPIITEIAPLRAFFAAEEEHQNYFKNNPEKAYCQLVINPKLAYLKKQFSNLLVS